MLAVSAQDVEIVVGICGLERRQNGAAARIGDGRGGQALVLVEVVGAVQRGVVLLSDGPSGGVDQGGVDLEEEVGFPGVGQAMTEEILSRSVPSVSFSIREAMATASLKV